VVKFLISLETTSYKTSLMVSIQHKSVWFVLLIAHYTADTLWVRVF